MAWFWIAFLCYAVVYSELHIYLDRHADNLLLYYNYIARKNGWKPYANDYFLMQLFSRDLLPGALSKFVWQNPAIPHNSYINSGEYRRLRRFICAAYGMRIIGLFFSLFLLLISCLQNEYLSESKFNDYFF